MPAITKNWISGRGIVFRWNLRDFELLDSVRSGLQPFSDIGKPILPPPTAHEATLRKVEWELRTSEEELEELKKLREGRDLSQGSMIRHFIENSEPTLIKKIEATRRQIKTIKDNLTKDKNRTWTGYTALTVEEETRITHELLDHIYKVSDVIQSLEPVKPIPLPAPEKQADDSIPVISFYQKDDYWQIGEEGNEVHLNPLKGYNFLRFLIRHENEVFDPITLYSLGNVPEKLRPLLSDMGSQEKCDKKTFALVQKEIEELYEEKKTVSRKRQEEIQEKIEKLEEYLARSNKFSSKSDKCRRNIQGLIKRAIGALHKEPALHPLKKYLTIKGHTRTIKIGYGSFYRSSLSDPVKWKLDSKNR